MRLIDANALKEKLQEHHDFFVNAYGGFKNLSPNDKSRVDEITHCISEIDNAPTVEPFEPDYVGAERLKARQRGYEEGYHNGMEIGKTLNPKIKQSEWIETEFGSKCPFCEVVNVSYYRNFCPNCGARMGGTT